MCGGSSCLSISKRRARAKSFLISRQSKPPRVIGRGSLEKRTGKHGVYYRFRHNLGKDPLTGKYLYSSWRTIHTSKKTEAKAAMEAYKRELNEGVYVDKSSETVGDYATKYHKLAEGTMSLQAYKTEASLVNKYIKVWFGNVKLQELHPDLIESVQSRAIKDEDISNHQIERSLKKLRQILNKAVRNDLIIKNPFDKVTIVHFPPDKTRESLTEEEAQRMFQIIWETDISSRMVAVFLMFDTGMRRGEALGLDWKHVDLENKTLRLSQAYSTSEKKVRHQKTESSKREIPINDDLAN